MAGIDGFRVASQPCLVVALLLGSFVGCGWAQEPNGRTPGVARSLAELEGVLEPGDTIALTDENGAEIKGTVVDLSASSLTLQSGLVGVFMEPSIVRIRRTDPSWPSMAIGAGAGFGAALFGAASAEGDAVYGWGYIAVWLFPAVGATVGWLIDRSTGNNPIFERPPQSQPSVSVAPAFGRGTAGVSVSVRF